MFNLFKIFYFYSKKQKKEESFIYFAYNEFNIMYLRRIEKNSMEEEKIKRKILDKKAISINIRISQSLSDWIKKNNYSYTKIFNETCSELGYKNGK